MYFAEVPENFGIKDKNRTILAHFEPPPSSIGPRVEKHVVGDCHVNTLKSYCNRKVTTNIFLFIRVHNSGGSRRKSDRGSPLQFWASWVWWAWLSWKLDLCNDVVKQNPTILIFRKLGSLKSDRGLSPLRPPLDPPLPDCLPSFDILNRF